jgi:hypothetical protein
MIYVLFISFAFALLCIGLFLFSFASAVNQQPLIYH